MRFDSERVRFSGLPAEWEEDAQRQFGTSLTACPRVDLVDGRGTYPDRIPALLVKLQKRLVELNGYEQEGMFRLAPDGEECAMVKRLINSGTGDDALTRCQDPCVGRRSLAAPAAPPFRLPRKCTHAPLKRRSRPSVGEMQAALALEHLPSRVSV